jgi:prefoldin subunit 1
MLTVTFNLFLSTTGSACYAGKKDWQAAIADAKECIKLDPAFVKGYYRLAVAQIESQDVDAATATIKQGLNADPNNPQLMKQLQSVKQLKKKLDKAANSTRMPQIADSGVSKELQELHMHYVQTVRDLKLAETNITKAQREYKAHELTKNELEKLPISDTDTRMYRSIGKMFMLSSRPEVMENIEKSMAMEKIRETDLLQKQEYLERRIKSQQQNIQELMPKR